MPLVAARSGAQTRLVVGSVMLLRHSVIGLKKASEPDLIIHEAFVVTLVGALISVRRQSASERSKKMPRVP